MRVIENPNPEGSLDSGSSDEDEDEEAIIRQNEELEKEDSSDGGGGHWNKRPKKLRNLGDSAFIDGHLVIFVSWQTILTNMLPLIGLDSFLKL